MPIEPSTYLTNFPLTAHQLNQDLYTYDGSYFNANGVQFHSNRPLMYESYQTESVLAAAKGGSFTILGGSQGNAISVIDNAALFGSGSDYPGNFATFWSAGAIAPGSAGQAFQYGGWELLFAFVPTGPFSGTSNTYGVVWNFQTSRSGIGSPLQDIGCMQPGSSARNNCGFAVDLINRATTAPTQIYAPTMFLTDPAGTDINVIANTTSTTGQTPRFGEIWMGVSNGNGVTVSTIPVPIPSIGTATTLSSATMNTTIQQTFNLLNNPPMLNVQTQSTTAATANVITNVPFTNTPMVDNYSKWSTASSHYIVPLTGVYLLHANIIFATSWNVGSGYVGFSVNTTQVNGGSYNATPVGAQNTGISATKVLDLNAGDTVSVYANVSASTSFGDANVSHFIMNWLAPINTSTQAWTPPNTTGFQFQAGYPPGAGSGGLVTLMNTKIANDINFLLNKPYLMVHQTTAQTSIAQTTWTSITMQSTVGQIHSSRGDNYSGWNVSSNHYVAPVAGWYLAVAELNAATTSTANSHFSLVCGFSVPTSGGVTAPTTPDWYQELLVPNSWTYPTGATGIGLYYLLPGETIAPVAQYIGATWATDVTHNFASHFNVIWMSNLGGVMTTPLDPYAAASSALPSATQSIIPGNIIGANSQTINTAQLNLSSSGGGAVLGYAGTPGAGNLVFSLSSASGTDTFGNTVVTGLSVGSGNITGVLLTSVQMDSTSTLQNTTINNPTVIQPSVAGGTATSLVHTMTNADGSVLGYTSGTVSATFATNGNYLWTCPTGITSVNIQCWGAGAGGGGGSGVQGGESGGGGEYAQEPSFAVTPGQVYPIIVGLGGSGGVTNNAGANGGATIFQNQGGGANVTANGGTAGFGGVGGNGGSGSVNTIHFDGGDGANGSGNTGGAGGGGSGGPSGEGNDGNESTSSTGAAGASAVSGGGAGGAGGNDASNGTNGGSPGGAGGGAGSNTVISSSKTYEPSGGTYAYRGSDATVSPNALLNHDGPMYQGFPNKDYGTQYSYWILPWSQIQSDMAGLNITSVSMKIKCLYSYYSNGVIAYVYYTSLDSFGNTGNSSGGSPVFSSSFTIQQNQTLTHGLGGGISGALISGAAKSIQFNSIPLTPAGDYYGSFDSGAGSSGVAPNLIVYYNNGGGSTAGTGSDGQCILSYQSGTVPTFQLSVSATTTTDLFGNVVQQGFTGPLLTLTPQSTTISTNTTATQVQANSVATSALMTNSAGFTGGMPAYQVDTSVQTLNGASSTGPTAITKNYVIPSGDMQVGTTYIIEVPFNGIFGDEIVEWGVLLNGSGLESQTGIGPSFFTSGTSYQGMLRGRLQVTTTGGSGAGTFMIDGGVGINANRSSGSNSNFAYLSGAPGTVAVNSTGPNTMSIYARFGATASGQTISGFGSTFARLGP